MSNWWDDGGNLIAFNRGSRAWITLNNDKAAHTQAFDTGLAAGVYCDVAHGTISAGSCSGPTVTVDRHGRASVTVPAKAAVAIDAGSRIRS